MNELVEIEKGLADALAHGIPLSDALQRLAGSSRSRALQRSMARLAADVERGQPLLEAMAEQPAVFPAEVLAVIRAGHAKGDLVGTLRLHVQASGRLSEGRQHLFSAAVYPGMVVLILACFCFLIGLFTLPEMQAYMAVMDPDLAGSAHLFVGIFQAVFLITGTAALALAGTFVSAFIRSRHRERALSALLRLMPGGRDLVEIWSAASTLRSLSAYVKFGIPLHDGLALCSGSQVLEKNRFALEDAAHSIEQGRGMVETMEKVDFLPPILPHLLASAGPQLAQELEAAASASDRDFDQYKVVFGQFSAQAFLWAVGALTAFVLSAFWVLYMQMLFWPIR